MSTATRFLAMALALATPSLAAPAADGFVTATFGGKDCQHSGTLTATDKLIRFDLSALPAGTKVLRAVLRVSGQGHQRGAAVKLVPDLAAAKPLALLGPEFNSFDATAAVRAWASKPSTNKGIRIEARGGVDFSSAVLLVSYLGKVDGPLSAVKGLKARHISGQTFLTWQEIDEPVGEDKPTFEKFEKAVLDARARRNLTYRVYRSGKPITLKTIGQSQLACEIPGYISGWNVRVAAVTRVPRGTKRKRSPLWPGSVPPQAPVVRYRVGPEAKPAELSRERALAVISPRRAGESYYAVTACIDGREALAALGAGNSLPAPVKETPCTFPVGIHQRTNVARSSTNEIFNTWMSEPFNNTPSQAELAILRWNKVSYGDRDHPVPLWLFTNSYSGGTTADLGEMCYGARRHIKGALRLTVTSPGVWQGWHECIGTLKGYDQGVVHPYPQLRVLAAARWGLSRPDLFADPERVYFRSQFGVWALRHPDVFAVVMSNGYANMSVGKLVQRYGHLWGPYPAACRNAQGVDYWEFMNYAKWVRENPTLELPYWVCAEEYGMYPSHTVGDFGFMPWPEMIHAMASTKRAFTATWNTNGPGLTRGLYGLLPRIKLHQSLPAFTHCNRDANPGDGDWNDADKTGAMNVYQMWEPETVVDEPGRWEITLHARDDCPAGELVTDVTPRRCQKFKAKAGEKFNWTLTPLKGGEARQQGTATADKWGLVTVEKLKLTGEKVRLSLRR